MPFFQPECPSIIELPNSPGIGPKLNQATSLGPFGTPTAPPISRPTNSTHQDRNHSLKVVLVFAEDGFGLRELI